MRAGVVVFILAVAISAIIHMLAVVGGIVLLAAPKSLQAAPVESLAVDLVSLEELAQVAKLDLPKLALTESPTAQPAQAQPAPAQPQPAQPAQPAPSQPAQVQPTQAQQPQAKPSQPAPARPAQARPAAPPPPDQSPFDPAKLAAMFPVSPVADPAEPRTAESGPTGFEAPADNAAKLSAEDIAAFKSHLKKCLALPAGVSATDKLKVVLRVALNPDGALRAQPMLLEASASPHGPAVVQSVMTALRQCQPYSFLPAEKYTEWKVLDMSFSPRDLAGG